MPSVAPCRFFKNAYEFVGRKRRDDIPDHTRGIYVLLKRKEHGKYDVVYIGCSAGIRSGIWARMKSHDNSKLDWTHFSVFEVHDNISREEIRELEGLFLSIYRLDSRANRLNRQRSHGKLNEIVKPLPKR